MKKINRCPMCGIHQLVRYSKELVVPIEDCFDMLHTISFEHDNLKAKADLLDEAIKVLTANCEQCPLPYGGCTCCACKKYAIVLKHKELSK